MTRPTHCPVANAKLATHAQMHDERFAVRRRNRGSAAGVGQRRPQELPSPRNRANAASLELTHEILCTASVALDRARIEHFDAFNHARGYEWLEASTNDLNLGKLGQRRPYSSNIVNVSPRAL